MKHHPVPFLRRRGLCFRGDMTMKTAFVIGVILLTAFLLASCSSSAPVERAPLPLSSALSASALCGNGLSVELSSPTCMDNDGWMPLFQKFCGDTGFSKFVLVTPCTI